MSKELLSTFTYKVEKTIIIITNYKAQTKNSFRRRKTWKMTIILLN